MSDEVNQLVKQGVSAVKAGDKQRARELLEQALERDEQNEFAWLWMSAAVDKPEEQEICLENVLTINPNNQHAQKGLRRVRKKLGKPETPPASAPSPSPEPAASWYDDEPAPAVQTPESWDEEEAGADDPHAYKPMFDFSAQSTGSTLGDVEAARTGRAKRKGAGFDLNREMALAGERPDRGFLALLDAWISALMFDGKGAYRAELPVATIGRTMLGVTVSSMLATIIIFVGMLVGLTAILATLDPTMMSQVGLGGFIVGGTEESIKTAVIMAPFWVVFFYAMAFGMSMAARLTGGDASFYDQSHLFSIAFSATLIIFALLVLLYILFTVLMIGEVEIRQAYNPYTGYIEYETVYKNPDALDRYQQIQKVLQTIMGIFLVYALLVWGHALGTAHGNGLILGTITAAIGLVVSVVCTIPVACWLLSTMMSV